MNTTTQINEGAQQHSTAVQTQGGNSPCLLEKEKGELKTPSNSKSLGSHSDHRYKGSSKKRGNEFTFCNKIGDLDLGTIRHILNILNGIARFDIDLVISCLKPKVQESAIKELEKLHRGIECIWRLFSVDGKQVDCEKTLQKLLLRSKTRNSTHDEQTQTDDVGEGCDVYQPKTATSIPSVIAEPPSDCERDDFVEEEMHIPSSTDQDSEVKAVSNDEVLSDGAFSSTYVIADRSLPMQNIPVLECSAIGCKSTETNRPDLAFFCFPLDVMRCMKWVVSCRRIDLAGRSSEFLSQNHFLCSLHFEEELLSDGSGVDKLVPSIFSFPADSTGDSNPAYFVQKGAMKIFSKCSAIGCGSTKENRPDLQFYRFPRNNLRCLKWVISCRRFDLVGKSAAFLNQNHFLCSNHFTKKLNSVGPMSDLFLPTEFHFPLVNLIDATTPSSSGTNDDRQQEVLETNVQIPTTALENPTLKQNVPILYQLTPTLMKKILGETQKTSTLTQKTPTGEMESPTSMTLKSPLKQESTTTIIQDSQSPLDLPSSIATLQPLNALDASSLDQEQMKIVLINPKTGQEIPVRLVEKSKTNLRVNPDLISPIIEKVSDTGLFTCDICNRWFRQQESLSIHQESHAKEKSSEDTCSLTCDLCNKVFTNRKSFCVHRESHDIAKTPGDKRSLTCGLCYKVSQNRKAHTRHMRTHKASFPCVLCNKVFRKQISLIRHGRIHDRVEASLTCEVCGKVFTNKKELYGHERAVHHPKVHTCERCGKRVKYLRAHLREHEEFDLGITHSCDICKKQFGVKKQLKVHMKVVHEPKKHLCSLCGKRYGTHAILKKHMVSHTGEKKFSCKVCSKSFSYKEYLKRHISHVHTGEKPHECDICQRRFSTKAGLKEHQVTHTGEKPFKCTICDASFYGTTKLTIHRFKIHGVNDPNWFGEKPYECPKCGLKLSLKSCLDHHLKFQCGDAPHRPERGQENRRWFVKCRVCSEIFYSFNMRQSHMELAHPEFSGNKCNICGKTVASWTNLLRHLREVHRGQRPYKCNICGRGFKQNSALDLHTWTHRQDKRYKCGLCGVGYNDKRIIMSHMRNVHKDTSNSSLYILLNEPAKE